MTTITAEAQRTYYEVIFGSNEEDRQVYIDHGDGSWLSKDAKVRANRFFFELSSKGVRCGFWADGKLTAGEDVCEVDEEPAPVIHKTRCTYDSVLVGGSSIRDHWGALVEQYDLHAFAFCSCGWRSSADDITQARAIARYHRAKEAA